MKPILIIASDKPAQNTLVTSNNVASAARVGYRVGSLMNSVGYVEQLQIACQQQGNERLKITGFLYSMGGSTNNLLHRHCTIGGYEKMVWFHKAFHLPTVSNLIAKFLTVRQNEKHRLVIDFCAEESDIDELQDLIKGQPITLMRMIG